MAQHLNTLGFSYVGQSGTNHPVFEHPVHGKTYLPLTPSETQAWQQNYLSRLARQMGMTKARLEETLGTRQPKREGPKVKRTRNEAGRQARRFTVVRDEGPKEPVRAGGPAERINQIKRDRIAAEGRQMRADHGTAAYMCALDDIARCRREIAQVQTEMEAAA